jgi:drug/metabolite transporter (DMT)-like permease
VIAAGFLWIPFTLLAAAGQTARNAMQRELTAKLGTVGATHVRFLFGFPFALVFLAGVFIATGLPMPALPWMFWPWAVVGAGAQILATALMLATMNDRSFVVTIAYIKTEAIQAAIFGLICLGDPLTIGMVVAILVATAGVVTMSLKGKGAMEGGYRPVALGLFSGAVFAISAVGYRGAILSLGLPSFLLAATLTLAIGLILQAGLLTLYLTLRARAVLTAIARAWRPSSLRASWVRRHRSSGSSPSRSRVSPTCGRWRWSKFCSPRPSQSLRSSRRRRNATRSASPSSWPVSCC